MTYELLFGFTPFRSRTRYQIGRKIINSSPVFPDKESFNLSYSDEFVDLIMKLLIKDKQQRLGSVSDATEILAHPWFADIDLRALESMEITPPIIPGQEGEDNMQYFKTT